ncbi:LCP family glycopolymer transferase [Listeria fleischmannii]|uniref:LCP family glycopolymer transferase n=1 Tax=Listeria fleischmannii TaxID=1069827 RepID=UPI000DD3B501|nr:LCP family protein [Listeria fleischmannii]
MNNLRSDKQKKKKRKGLKIFLIILLVFVLGIAGYLGYAYWKTTSTFNKIHTPIEGKENASVRLDKKQPFSVLILGVDERSGDKGRSDTLIAATVNPTKNKIQMLSIPRDTKTTIPGYDSNPHKINAAYAYGGVKMTDATTTQFLNGIPFNYYIKINMEGFRDLVNAVGGVDVVNDKDGLTLATQSSEGNKKVFNKGKIHLNGEDALAYVRIRKSDAEGDFGRQKRQQQVMSAVAEKALSTGLIWRFDGILNAIGDNIQTDFTMNDITRIAKDYRSTLSNVENLQVKGEGSRIDGGPWYYVVSDAERARLHDELAENLGMK